MEMENTTDWRREKILIVGKTYPVPSKEHVETVCTAGVTESGEWRRLHPIPFRYLENEQQFPAFSWIIADVRRYKSDPRKISYQPRPDSIRVIGIEKDWDARRAHLLPLQAENLEEWDKLNKEDPYHHSMTIVEVAYDEFFWEKSAPDWSPAQRQILSQQMLFEGQPKNLDKVPYRLRLRFRCKNNPDCEGHRRSVISWELSQAFLRFRREYRGEEGALATLKKMFEDRFTSGARDLFVMVGSLKAYPRVWTIGGLFYPPARLGTQSYLF